MISMSATENIPEFVSDMLHKAVHMYLFSCILIMVVVFADEIYMDM